MRRTIAMNIMDLDIPARVKEDITEAAEKPLLNFFENISKIVLFGSYATGKYQPDSDIDLAVMIKELPFAKERLRYKQAVDIDRDVDLLFCFGEQLEKGEFVYKYVREQGITVYEQL